MERGPEPRRENPVLFHKHLVGKKKKKNLTTKEALCLRLFQFRVLARTDPPRAQVRWKEKKELYLVNNFHESVWGKNVCNLAVCFALGYKICQDYFIIHIKHNEKEMGESWGGGEPQCFGSWVLGNISNVSHWVSSFSKVH